MYQTFDLCKEYGAPPQAVLQQVNLHIPKGSLFGLLGPNGAGKTTLLSILAGLVPKTRGRVLVNGVELETCLEAVRAATGIVPQDLALYPMLSAQDNLSFFADALGLRGPQRRRNMEFAIGMTRLDGHLKKKVENFSGGLKRRLNLAIGLLNRPSVLFLDEPTVGIDPQTRGLILQNIKSLNGEGMTIVYTSHYMEEVQQICDRVAIIDHGTILIQDEISRLLRRGGDQALRITFAAADAERIRSRLSAHYPVALEDAYTLRIETLEPLIALRLMSAELPEPAPVVEHISYGCQNLQELFLSLTGKQTRDDHTG